ncbi:hypothetical protein G6O69_08475 [Pseudenhygromyxa sp. WMMC2535]|uniref:hypothetical protein n=1 Tax=Pseudenhygromyxa sp. WMMC2535 TaxID=2712867 RepID=UPI001551B430|nr:hypothetical protein [Pseudenhygromyxa sp. WMMC2535]NVB37867.1 hypothetical protein [Pseudenhygromyxa sp. WMMC2535]
MKTRRASASIVLLSLATLGCRGGGQPEAAPSSTAKTEEAQVEQAPASAEPPASEVDASKAAPGDEPPKPEDSSDAVEAAASAEPPGPALSLAFRSDSLITIFDSGTQAFIIYDDGVVPLSAKLTRAEILAAPKASWIGRSALMTTVAYVQADDGRAWWTLDGSHTRSPMVEITDYVLRDGQWKADSAGNSEHLDRYFSEYLRVGDRVLGVPAYTLAAKWEDEFQDESEALAEAVERELAAASRRFVDLSDSAGGPGSSEALPPEPPEGAILGDIVGGSDGWIYAVAIGSGEDGQFPEGSRQLIAWSPGASEARVLTFPDPDFEPKTLRQDNHGVLVSDRLRLMAVEAGVFTPVKLELPAAALEDISLARPLRDIARADDGGLWLLLNPQTNSDRSLWHRDTAGRWTQLWLEIPEALSADVEADSRSKWASPLLLAWSEGALWIDAEIGVLWTSDNIDDRDIVRWGIYTTASFDAPIVLDETPAAELAELRESSAIY